MRNYGAQCLSSTFSRGSLNSSPFLKHLSTGWFFIPLKRDVMMFFKPSIIMLVSNVELLNFFCVPEFLYFMCSLGEWFIMHFFQVFFVEVFVLLAET